MTGPAERLARRAAEGPVQMSGADLCDHFSKTRLTRKAREDITQQCSLAGLKIAPSLLGRDVGPDSALVLTSVRSRSADDRTPSPSEARTGRQRQTAQHLANELAGSGPQSTTGTALATRFGYGSLKGEARTELAAILAGVGVQVVPPLELVAPLEPVELRLTDEARVDLVRAANPGDDRARYEQTARELADALGRGLIAPRMTAAELGRGFGASKLTSAVRREIGRACTKAGISVSPSIGNVPHGDLVTLSLSGRRTVPKPPGAEPPTPANRRGPNTSKRNKIIAASVGGLLVLLLLAGILGGGGEPPAPDRAAATTTTTPPPSTTTAGPTEAEQRAETIRSARQSARDEAWSAVDAALADPSLTGRDRSRLRRYARRIALRSARSALAAGRDDSARRTLIDAESEIGLDAEGTALRRQLSAAKRQREAQAAAERQAARAQRRGERQAARQAREAREAGREAQEAAPEPDTESAPDGDSGGGYTGNCDTSPSDIPVTPGSPGDRDGDGVACES